jgi:polyisoprenoid-binding protein YceI
VFRFYKLHLIKALPRINKIITRETKFLDRVLIKNMKWYIDNTHSSVEFSVRHMGIAWVRGRFLKFEGTADFDPQNLEAGLVEVKIDASSISTGNEKRDDHLRSPDFFDVQNHPLITFKSMKVNKAGKNYRVSGDLTMRGVTKPVTLEVEFFGVREIPSGDGKSEMRAGLSAKTVLNRHDFGVNWDAPAGEGASMAGEEVEVTINIELVKE